MTLRPDPPSRQPTNEKTDDESESAPKKRRFGLGLKSRRDAANIAADDSQRGRSPASEPTKNRETIQPGNDTDRDDNDAKSKTSREGLGGWFGRKRTAAADKSTTEPANRDGGGVKPPSDSDDDGDQGDGEYVDPNSVDWNSMNKTEKRRMKKQMRRQDRAA